MIRKKQKVILFDQLKIHVFFKVWYTKYLEYIAVG